MPNEARGPEPELEAAPHLPSYLDIDPVGFFLAAPVAYAITALADPSTFWWFLMLAGITVVLGFILGTVIQIQANAAYVRGRTDGVEFGKFLQNRDHEWRRQEQQAREDRGLPS